MSKEIQWVLAADAGSFADPERQQCQVLMCDLRDPLILPLLRPAPVDSDFRDEARPGASDRAYFLARRACLRSLVALRAHCAADDVRIGYDAPGAPRVLALGGGMPPADIFVSVSGRGSLAALAVSATPSGVDIEPWHRDVEIVRAVLHRQERALLADLLDQEKQRHFLRIWTAKEAFLKAMGLGLNIDPSGIAVEIVENIVAQIHHDGQLAPASGQIREFVFDDTPVIAACVTFHSASERRIDK